MLTQHPHRPQAHAVQAPALQRTCLTGGEEDASWADTTVLGRAAGTCGHLRARVLQASLGHAALVQLYNLGGEEIRRN